MALLRSSFLLLAMKLQEAADLTASDVASRLQDQIGDMHRGTGHFGAYLDHSGDDKSGDVIYSVDGNTVKAPYEMSGGDGTAAKCFIHADKASNVVPRTVYEPEDDQDELDQYAQMESARLYSKGRMPLVERQISKSERDAADSGSFAGKGKSFPILKSEDVAAAAHALGRAGSGNYSTDVIKKNIIRIAKAKGWTSELPQAWQDDGTKESARRTREAKKPTKDCADCKASGDCATCDGSGKKGKGDNATDCKDCDGSGDCDTCDGSGQVPVFGSSESRRDQHEPAAVSLCESAAFPQTYSFVEASATNPLVKIISPGRGSSGYYGKEMLQQAADDKIFGRGTLMYFNHATKAEETARPEGDWNKLAAVTTGDAYWDDAGKDGPALYAPAKVFAKHAAEVAEKAPHTGVSIRASGMRDDKAMGPDGKPGVITKLLRAESIDLVTKAGRDGKLLLESADSNLTEGGPMADTDLKKLQEANRQISKRLARGDAREAAEATLRPIRLPESAKVAIVEKCCVDVPITEAGDFDKVAFKALLEAEIQYAARFVPNGVKISGVGAGATAPDPKVVEAQRVAEAKDRDRAMDRSARQMGVRTKEGLAIFREGRRAFDPSFCNSPVEATNVG
jgi:hypothetical protein